MIELAAVVIVLALLIYQPSLNGSPLWDDLTALDANIRAGKLDRAFLDLLGQGHSIGALLGTIPLRVVTRASWALTFRVARGKLDGPVLHHLVSIGIHAAVAMATIPIARALDINEVVAALIVVAHPLAVSSVASVGQRASALSTLFVVVAVDLAIYGSPLVAIPFVALALASKEDALGLVSLVALATPAGRANFSTARAATGLAAAGQSTSLPFREHVPTATAANLARLPGWFIGLGFDVLYDHAIWVGHSSLAFLVAISAVTSTLLLYIQGEPWSWLVLAFWLSPFVLYWFVPLPHPIVDSRAYSLTVIVGLALASLDLPVWAVVIAVAYFATRSATLSWRYESAERYWRSSKSRSETAQINLAATLQSIGKLDEAATVLQRVVDTNPSSGIGWANLGLIAEARARHYYTIATQEAAQLGRPGPHWSTFTTMMKAACQLLERGRQHCPADQTVLFYHQRVHQLAKELRVTL